MPEEITQEIEAIEPEQEEIVIDDNINIDADPEPSEKPEAEAEQGENTGAEQEADPIEKAKEKTPPWFQKRMDEMTWKLNEERREREELERRLNEKKVDDFKPPAFEKPKPTREQFDYDDDAFLEALTDWKLEKYNHEHQAKTQAQQQVDAEAQQAQTFNEKRTATMERGIGKFEDFAQTINALPGDVMNAQVAATLVETPNSEDVVYFLGKNVQEAQRISRLNPIQMAIEIGAISTKLSTAPSKKITSAPEPIKPLSGSSGVAKKDPSQMTDKEYSKWRRERIKKRR